MNNLISLDDLDIGFGGEDAAKYVEPVQQSYRLGQTNEGGERVPHFKLAGGSQMAGGKGYKPKFVSLAYPEEGKPDDSIPDTEFKGLTAQVLNMKGGFQLTCYHTPFGTKSNQMKWSPFLSEIESFMKGVNDLFVVYPQALLQAKKLLNQLPKKADGSYDLEAPAKPLYLHTYSQLRYILKKIDAAFKAKIQSDPEKFKDLPDRLWEDFAEFEKSLKIKVKIGQDDLETTVHEYFNDHDDDVVMNMEKMAKKGEICEKFYTGKAGAVKPDMQFFPFDVKYPFENFQAGKTMSVFESVPGKSGRTSVLRLKVAEPTPRLRISLLKDLPEFKLTVDGSEFRLDTYASKDSTPLWNFLVQNFRTNKGLSNEDFFILLNDQMAKKAPSVIVEEFLMPITLIGIMEDDRSQNPLQIEVGINIQPTYNCFTYKKAVVKAIPAPVQTPAVQEEVQDEEGDVTNPSAD